jgi:Cytochrome P450
MSWTIAALIAAVLLYLPIRIFVGLRRNIAAAKATGIPYIVIPVFQHGLLWQAFAPLVTPLLGRLPEKYRPCWLGYIEPEYNWRCCRKPFEQLGADTIFFVTPDNLYLSVADPAVVNQITTRRNDFPKPIEMYKGVDIYGKNVVTCEGMMWRRHRKTTAPPFGEKNNRMVWQETLFQARGMMAHWSQSDESDEKKSSMGSLLEQTSHDCMRLSLYVISRAGFDIRCEWPGQKSSDLKEGIMSATEIPKGHTMSYVDSMETLLHNMLPLFALPPQVIGKFSRIACMSLTRKGYAPFKMLQLAHKSYYEWGNYMNELYNRKKEDIIDQKGVDADGMDLMGSMIRGSGQIPNTPNYGKPDVGLTREEILGNSFILFLAGHETAANSMHFSLLMLAARPSFQRRVQGKTVDNVQDQ